MAELDRMQRSWIRASALLTEAFMTFRDDARLGDRLVASYIDTGKGDRHDIFATLVDCVADLGFAICRRGDDFAVILSEVARDDASCFESEMILALRQAYRSELPGYRDSHDFSDILRIAGDHNGIEMMNGDRADYGTPSFR